MSSPKKNPGVKTVSEQTISASPHYWIMREMKDDPRLKGVDGMTYMNECMILIEADNAATKRAETMAHEVTHAVNSANGITVGLRAILRSALCQFSVPDDNIETLVDEIEEYVTNQSAVSFIQVLAENPAFIRKLLKMLNR